MGSFLPAAWTLPIPLVHPHPAGGTALPSMPTVPALQRPSPPARTAGQLPVASISCCAGQVGDPGRRAQATSREADGQQRSTPGKPMRVDGGQVREGRCRLGTQVCMLPGPRPQRLAALPVRLPPSTCPLPSSRCGPVKASLAVVAAQPSLAACSHQPWLWTGRTWEKALLAGCLCLTAGALGGALTAPEAPVPTTQTAARMAMPPRVP